MPALQRGRLVAVASTTLLALLAMSGCGVIDNFASGNPEPSVSSSSDEEATEAPEPADSETPEPAETDEPSEPAEATDEPTSVPNTDATAEPTADPTALPQTCQLLTSEEVKTLTGLAVNDQTPVDEEGKRGCEWTLGGKHLVVELSNTSEALFKDEADGYDPVTGVGDQAYSQLGLVFARKATTSIYVDAPGDDDAAQIKVGKDVALKVIEKLG